MQYFPEGVGSAFPPADMPEGEAHEKKAQCESEEGFVGTESWSFTLIPSPDNLNWDEALKDCLIRAQILDSGSSVDDMRKKMAAGDDSLESEVAQTKSRS